MPGPHRQVPGLLAAGPEAPILGPEKSLRGDTTGAPVKNNGEVPKQRPFKWLEL